MKRDTSRDKTDQDVIKDNHKFLWDTEVEPESWEERLAKKYYDKLFKEYCICDLSRYKENKVAMRWRIEKEVVTGKGQFICGNKVCLEKEGLRSWEVNFAYVEKGESKNALVKLRLCEECSSKLNYYSKKREVKRLKKNKYIIKKQRSRNSKDKEENGEASSGSGSSRESTSNMETENPEKIPSSSSQIPVKSISDPVANESIWSKKSQLVEEKSREDEFDEYLQDLLL